VKLSLEEYKNFNKVFEEDVYNFLSSETCLKNKKTEGSPNPQMIKETINNWKNNLD